MDHLAEGTIAPDFQLLTVNGVGLRLSRAVQSGPVILVFYKASCPTCQFTLPLVEQIVEEFDPRTELAVWGVSQDDHSETSEFVSQKGLTFPVLLDGHPYPVSNAYAVRFVPTVYVVDPDRRIRLADFGFSKSALRVVVETLAGAAGCQAPQLFVEGDGLPETRPG